MANNRLQNAVDLVEGQPKVAIHEKVVVGGRIRLLVQEMYDHLVELYVKFFTENWSTLKHCASSVQFEFPPDVDPPLFVARTYVSGWILDLYRSIRESLASDFVRDLNINRPVEYARELQQVSHQYDTYLQRLNSAIRPVLVDNANFNGLLIPVLGTPVENDTNPFGINAFSGNMTTCRQLHRILIRARFFYWEVIDRQTPIGTVCWLYDWPHPRFIGDWIPGPFSRIDMVLAYILGTAMTANMGIKDSDRWRLLQIVPAVPDLRDYNRLNEKCSNLKGFVEVSYLEVDTDFSGVRIVDGMYHKVVEQVNADIEDRYEALKLLIAFP